MFQIEELHNPIAKNFKNKGGSGLINILPLDNIPVQFRKPWSFKPTCIAIEYHNRAEELASFEVREDDIWIVTFPKCGTTWTQEMVWMLANDFNYDKANSVDLTERSVFFELQDIITTNMWNSFELLKNQKSPRVIKTHLPIGLLPRDIWRKKCKIIYVTRDPKDMIVSFYHHFIGITKYNGSIEEFTEQILTDNMIYCSFWNHVLEFWLIREQSNILFFTFEDMKDDLNAIIQKTSKFLQKDCTEEQIRQLMEHLSFDNMKANPTCNNQSLVEFLKQEINERNAFTFLRKGKVGEYRKALPLSYIEKINAKTKAMFQQHGLNLYCDDNETSFKSICQNKN